MANSDLPSRYTDQDYVTRNGLSRALGTSLVDDFWKAILNYRLDNAKKVALLGVGKRPFHIVLTLPLGAKIKEIESKLSAFGEMASSFAKVANFSSFERESLLSLLSCDSKLEKKNVDDLTLKAMVNGFYREQNTPERPVFTYLNLLKGLSEKPVFPNEDYLGESYVALMGREDLSSFYREKDPVSVYNTAVIARDYDYAPHGEIPSMMDSLFAFLLDASAFSFVKACGALYYLNYVKPFEEHNLSLGCLLAKASLSPIVGSCSYLIPFEKCLLPSPSLKDILNQSQKDHDLTYFVLHCAKLISAYLDEAMETMARRKKEAVVQEVFGKPEETKAEPEPEAPQVEPEKEQKPEEPLKKAPSPSRLSEEEEKAYLQSKGEAAVTAPKGEYSDKEIKDTAKYLLETHPSLRKKQALFYASHCTLGRFYTIQDYKRFSRCVYETARTSMDHLAELGFYAKKQIKNKFVYTPLKQGEQK